jgi:hypothetical protein
MEASHENREQTQQSRGRSNREHKTNSVTRNLQAKHEGFDHVGTHAPERKSVSYWRRIPSNMTPPPQPQPSVPRPREVRGRGDPLRRPGVVGLTAVRGGASLESQRCQVY